MSLKAYFSFKLINMLMPNELKKIQRQFVAQGKLANLSLREKFNNSALIARRYTAKIGFFNSRNNSWERGKI